MNVRRGCITGLAVLAGAALALAGCGKAGTPGGAAAGGASPSAAASPTAPDPKAVLAKSVSALQTTPFKFAISMDNGMTGSGSADPAAHKGHALMSGTTSGVAVKMDMIMIEQAVWLKMDLGAQANRALGINPAKYMHIDATKLKNPAALGLNTTDADPAESAKLMRDLVDAQRIDDTHYKATIDASKAEDSSLSQDTLNKLGDKAKALPATITLDGQGRLIEMDLDLSAVTAGMVVKDTYSDYGTPVTIDQPAKSSVIEAPQKVYDMFDQ